MYTSRGSLFLYRSAIELNFDWLPFRPLILQIKAQHKEVVRVRCIKKKKKEVKLKKTKLTLHLKGYNKGPSIIIFLFILF